MTVILLGVFVGSAYSLVSESSVTHLPTYLQDQGIMIGEADEVGWKGGFEMVEAPPNVDDLENSGVLDVGGAETTVWDRGTKNQVYNQQDYGWEMPTCMGASISVDSEGLMATDLEAGERVLYVGYDMAIIRLPPGKGLASIRDLIRELEAIVVDEMEEKIFLLVPSTETGKLDQLLEQGKIVSFEVGGWGSGFGKM